MASVGASIGCGWDDDISCICAGESQIALVKANMRRDQAEIASTLQKQLQDGLDLVRRETSSDISTVRVLAEEAAEGLRRDLDTSMEARDKSMKSELLAAETALRNIIDSVETKGTPTALCEDMRPTFPM